MSIVKKTQKEEELDLISLIKFLLGKIWIGILVGCILGGLIFGALKFMVVPTYSSHVRLYVNNFSVSKNGDKSITYSDLTTSILLTDTLITIVGSETVVNDVMERADVQVPKKVFRQMFNIQAVKDTEVLEITVTSRDPQLAKDYADMFAEVATEKVGEIIEGSAVKVIDYAELASEPDSSGKLIKSFLGFCVGLMITMIIILIQGMSETLIKTEKDLESFNKPFLGIIPNVDRVKDRNKSAKKRRKKNSFVIDENCLLNENSPFSIREAYNTLRTNLIFSVSGRKCKKILITSTVAHEGKSSTAINLGRVLAESGYRVLLLDCDLRMSAIAESLNIQKTPGLSDLLVGIKTTGNLIINYLQNYDILPSGTVPPNPSELLGSDEMGKVINKLESAYDYIIMDAPPLGPVSDATILAKYSTGYMMVVRSSVPKIEEVERCMRDISVSNTKMLGFVFTCADIHKGNYNNKNYNYYYKNK